MTADAQTPTMSQFASKDHMIEYLQRELAAAKAEANSLKEALKKYGEHDVGCALLGTHEPCSCGLDNILDAISKE